MTTVSFSIKSDMAQVSIMGQLIMQLCKLTGFSEADCRKIQLAVVEAVNNVVEHAYKMQSHHTVEVACTVTSDAIKIKICDTGLSLDVKLLEKNDGDYAYSDNINALPEGGWGLRIIQSLVDEISYTSADGINCMQMVKNK